MNLPQKVYGVNIAVVTSANSVKTRKAPYHHGDLRNALVEAAVELAHEGGPAAIVLREAARRVGVSPNAAYRHFDALPDLIADVARVALARMAASMRIELAKCVPSVDPGLDARENLLAVGRGYVLYALQEPGLFSTAFSCPEETARPEPDSAQEACTPDGLLHQALNGLVATGLLNPAEYDAAATTAWAVVHGIALLLLGPMSEVPPEERTALIDACLKIVGRGLTG